MRIREFPQKMRRLILDAMPDKMYLEMRYRQSFGKKLDLKNPKTFNEKMQWLKLYDRNPLYTSLVDKCAVKEYISAKFGQEFVIPTIREWDSVDDIDFSELPNAFVLKCNHDSGQLVICKDKSGLDISQAKAQLKCALNNDYYLMGREWPYKGVPRKVFAEKYVYDATSGDLKDYKFFCFNGEVKFFKIDFGRFTNHHANYYDLEGNLLNFGEANYPPRKHEHVIIPSTIGKMVEMAEALCGGIPFVRVDFYDVNGKILFGELTFYPASGFGHFIPEIADEELGRILDLPR